MSEQTPDFTPHEGDDNQHEAVLYRGIYNGEEVDIIESYLKNKIIYARLADGRTDIPEDQIKQLGKKETRQTEASQEAAEELGKIVVDSASHEPTESTDTVRPITVPGQQEELNNAPPRHSGEGGKNPANNNSESQKSDIKFKRGDDVKVKTRNRKHEYIWKVNAVFVGKKGRIFVRVIEPDGKFPERVIPQEQLLEWNPNFGKPSQETDTPQHNKEPEPKKDATNKDDIQDPKDKGNGNGNGNNNDSPETANGSDENEWLDPRFILFLKEKYKQMLEDESINAARVRDKLTDHYKKDIIRTRVIELVIRNRIGRDQWLAGARYGENRLAGFESSNNHEIQRPSEEILQEIASKMDLSNEELMLEASDKNKKLNEHVRKFKPGEKVRIFLRGGKGDVDNDWIVKGYQNDYAPGVLVTKGKEVRKFSEKQLREFQDRPQPSEIENNIERLKPFFGKTVKILEDGQVVEAKFAGVRIDGKFYIDQETGEFVTDSNGNVWTDEQNNPIPKHTRQEFDFDKIDEFLSWQSLKTEAEIAAEQIAKQAAKVERINREMPEDERKFELGQEVKIMRGKTVDTGWTVDDFKKAGNKVEVVLIKEGKRFSAEQEMLANWQLSPEGFVPSIEPKDDDKSSDKQDASQDNKDEKQKSDPNNRYKDKENHIKKLEERLVKLKEEEIRKSMWEKRTAQWKNFWKQFDAGETSREVRLNKRRKKIARIAGGVAVVGLWPVTIYGGVVGSGALFSNQKYHNTIRRIHNREISTLERDIREEKEELERIKKKDAETK
jgi:hypothetical protein